MQWKVVLTLYTHVITSIDLPEKPATHLVCTAHLLLGLSSRSVFHVDISVKISQCVDHMSTYNTTWNFVNTVCYSLALSYIVSPPCLLPGEMIDMIDSLIFFTQRKREDILQIWKCSVHCNRRWLAECYICRISWKVWHYFVAPQVFRVPFDMMSWNIFCRHWHGFLMSTTCRHNCMSMTALLAIQRIPEKASPDKWCDLL